MALRASIGSQMYSIIIPAYNEEDWLVHSIPAARLAMDGVAMRGEIVVVDNNSTDSTSAVAESLGGRVVFEPINQISRARNTGARAANGDFYIFLDADTLLTGPLLAETLDALRAHACGGGARVSMDAPRNNLAQKLFMLVVAMVQLQKVATGCFMFCRADAFFDIGGFSERLFATEEYWFCLKLKRWGRKHGKPFRLLRENPVVTSSRKFDDPHSLWAMLVTVLVPFSMFFRSTCRFWYKR